MTKARFPQIDFQDVPLSKEEFYKQRDDRTLRVTNANDYRNAHVLLTGNVDALESYSGQLSLLTAGNIISRFTTNIDVVIPDANIHSNIQCESSNLREQCRREMYAADPFGDFKFLVSSPAGPYDAALIIGEDSAPAESIVKIDSAGWSARVAPNTSLDEYERHPRNPVGPGIAASFGAAEIFKSITESGGPNSTEYTFNAYTLSHETGFKPCQIQPQIPDALNLGNIQMVGAGAVGSATLYFLRHVPLRDTLTVIDPDVVEVSNLNRTPLFTTSDAINNTPKIDVVKRFVGDFIETSTHQKWYSEYKKNRDSGDPDLVLPLANERRVRTVIQNNYPPVMLHTTTGGWAVDVRRSIPTVDACLRCHFPPNSEFSTICGEGPIHSTEGTTNSEELIQGALPFISPLAGVLLTGELVKLTLDEYPVTDNHATIGVRNPTAFSGPWGQRDDCEFCKNTDDAMYRRLIAGTKFAHLSTPSE